MRSDFTFPASNSKQKIEVFHENQSLFQDIQALSGQEIKLEPKPSNKGKANITYKAALAVTIVSVIVLLETALLWKMSSLQPQARLTFTL